MHREQRSGLFIIGSHPIGEGSAFPMGVVIILQNKTAART
jgi:hypothetical protein